MIISDHFLFPHFFNVQSILHSLSFVFLYLFLFYFYSSMCLVVIVVVVVVVVTDKICGLGATYGGVMRGQDFGAVLNKRRI